MKNNLLYLLSDVSILSSRDAYDKAYAACPPFRQQKADRFRFAADKWLCVGVWNLLFYALSQYGIRFDPGLYSTSANGKPMYPGIEFSLSHSGNYAACAVNRNFAVGCDIEIVTVHNESVVNRVCSPSEHEFISGSDDRFTRIWTLRESVMKCTGLGFALEQKSFSVFPGIGMPVDNHFDNQKYFTAEVEAPNGYCASLCVQTDSEFRYDLQIQPLEKILDML